MLKRFPKTCGVALSACALLLSGCEDIGDGNSLESLRIVPVTSGVDGDTQIDVYTCLSSALQAVGTFDDGGQGTFTTRAVWRSSNPDVVDVSNRDIEVSGTEGFFNTGVLVPRAPGTAVITAEFVGLTASIDVTVNESGGFELTPQDSRVATSTSRLMELVGLIDGEELLVNNDALFSIAGEDPDDDDLSDNTAVIDQATGVLNSLNPGEVEVEAYLPICDATVYTAAVSVQDPEAIVIQHEEGFDGRLMKDTTEVFQIFADFGDGPEQDLSTQLNMTASDTDIARFASAAGTRNVLTALEAGEEPIEVHAVLSYGDDPETEEEDPSFELESNRLQVTVLDETPLAIDVSPEEAVITGLGATFDFDATATFESGYTQLVTRHVSWSSSDTDTATIASGIVENAGRATSRVDDGGAVTITATNEDVTEQPTDTAVLTIEPEM